MNSSTEPRFAAWAPWAGLVTLVLVGLKTVGHPGIWMHLSMGRWISESGLPRTDPFTLAQADTPWMNGTWLYDWLMFTVHRIGGMTGLTLVHIACAAVALWLMARVASRFAGPLAIGGAIVLSSWILLPIFDPSPALVAILFAAGLVSLLSRRPLTGKGLVGVFAIQLLWANMSTSCVAGILLCLLFAIGTAYRGDASGPEVTKTSIYLAAAGIAVIACCLNPYGPVLLKVGFMDSLGIEPQMATVWVSPFASAVLVSFPRHLITVALAIGVGGLLTYRDKLPLGLTLTAILGLVCAYSSRHLAFFAVLACPFIALSLSAIAGAARARLPAGLLRTAQTATAIALVGLCLFTAGAAVTNRTSSWLGSVSRFGLGTESAVVPSGVIPVLETMEPGLRLINHPFDAGFLLWHLPDIKVLADPRLNVHDSMQLQEIHNLLIGQPEAVDLVMNRERPDAVLLNLAWLNSIRLFQTLVTSDGWELAYFDGTSALLRTTSVEQASSVPPAAVAGLKLLEASRAEALDAARAGSFSPEAGRMVGAGLLYHTLRQWAQSAAAHELVVAHYPCLAEGWYRLAQARAQTRDLAGSEGAMKRAIGLLPEEPRVLQTAAELYDLMDQPELATQFRQRAAETQN